MGITQGGSIKTQAMSDIAALRLQNIKAQSSVRNSGFAEILNRTQTQKQADDIKFSKHAEMRLEQRGIFIGDGFIEELKSAISLADTKGVKNVAIISSKGAFIVNVPNRTVVTGMTRQEMKNNIFTNIDAAISL